MLFRSPVEGVFRIARDIFTEPQLFDLEMELIFEKNWIYACHESELANNHDFVTMRAGRQPMIITRDGDGQLLDRPGDPGRRPGDAAGLCGAVQPHGGGRPLIGTAPGCSRNSVKKARAMARAFMNGVS